MRHFVASEPRLLEQLHGAHVDEVIRLVFLGLRPMLGSL